VRSGVLGGGRWLVLEPPARRKEGIAEAVTVIPMRGSGKGHAGHSVGDKKEQEA